jgi:photosystem II stability/assembly factor-like uncharacterized protein
VEKGVIWAGTNDGLVQITRDDGETWTNVTANVPDLPPWGSVHSIAASKWDAGTAYMVVDFHQMDNRDPFVYRTRDYGKSWQKIVTGIPKSMLSYGRVIAEDPVRQGLLYLGVENAIYVSFDAGDHWQPLQNDLPHAPVSGIVVQEHFNDLVISTYGRGFFILDDIGPLQQLTPEVMASAAHLFTPRDAYRFRPITRPSTTYDDPTEGEDPEYGAYIDYWLQKPAGATPTLEILDSSGDVVRTLDATNGAGVNRVVWDLEGEPGEEVRLLTPPRYAEWMGVPPEGRSAGRALSILMPPGTYTVRLTVDGATQTRPLTVLKDPHSAGSEAEIAEQIALLRKIREDQNRGAREVNRVEAVRVQLRTLARFADDAEVKAAALALEKKLADTEMNLVDLRLTGRGQDGVRFDSKLLPKLGYLAGGLEGADFRPTDQQVEVQELLSRQVGEQIQALDAILSGDLATFNEQLRSKGLGVIADGGA